MITHIFAVCLEEEETHTGIFSCNFQKKRRGRFTTSSRCSELLSGISVMTAFRPSYVSVRRDSLVAELHVSLTWL